MVVNTVVDVLRCSCSAQECCLHLQLLVGSLFGFFFASLGVWVHTCMAYTPVLGTDVTLYPEQVT